MRLAATNDTANAPRCWVITDGAAGNERQALALAEAMGLQPQVFRIGLRFPWSWLAPRFRAGGLAAVAADARSKLAPPWPQLVIGCGRKSAQVTLAVRDAAEGACFAVQILDPRIATQHFDLIIAPRHDGLTGANVLQTLGSLNPVGSQWLAAAARQFPQLSELPAPRTAVLIGASTRAQQIGWRYVDGLMETLDAWMAEEGGSLLLSTSRRTSERVRRRLLERCAQRPGRFWTGPADGENPYAGMLAAANRIVVSPDSVNMLSEACATGKPVYTFAPRPVGGKLAAFHRALIDGGHLRALPAVPVDWRPTPLSETAALADLVGERWRRWSTGRTGTA